MFAFTAFSAPQCSHWGREEEEKGGGGGEGECNCALTNSHSP